MKIGILGTRGIPNHYGGFEQFAEYFAARLVALGEEVWVYNSHMHPYKKREWKGVNIIHCFDPEYIIGPVGPFFYDLNCIIDSHKRHFDVILQLGYASAAVWYGFHPKSPAIVTNMDGLEWSRSKYRKPVQRFIRSAERWAVNKSDLLVADSIEIHEYFQSAYHKPCLYIPYGAEPLKVPDPTVPASMGLIPYSYFLAISRIQSDNNPELIIRGFLESGSAWPLVLVGSMNNHYGKYLKEKYGSENIRFTGSIFDIDLLNQLRYFSNIYFHGHSSGGTNPSLLEAMASQALICAHDNRFNRRILGHDAYFFSNEHQIAELIQSDPRNGDHSGYLQHNLDKIHAEFQWDMVTKLYLEAFYRIIRVTR